MARLAQRTGECLALVSAVSGGQQSTPLCRRRRVNLAFLVARGLAVCTPSTLGPFQVPSQLSASQVVLFFPVLDHLLPRLSVLSPASALELTFPLGSAPTGSRSRGTWSRNGLKSCADLDTKGRKGRGWRRACGRRGREAERAQK